MTIQFILVQFSYVGVYAP